MILFRNRILLLSLISAEKEKVFNLYVGWLSNICYLFLISNLIFLILESVIASLMGMLA